MRQTDRHIFPTHTWQELNPKPQKFKTRTLGYIIEKIFNSVCMCICVILGIKSRALYSKTGTLKKVTFPAQIQFSKIILISDVIDTVPKPKSNQIPFLPNIPTSLRQFGNNYSTQSKESS